MILKLIFSVLLILAAAIVVSSRQHASMTRPPNKQEVQAMDGFKHDWNADNKRRTP